MRRGLEEPPFISESEAKRIKDHAERDIVLLAIRAGYHVSHGPSVRCSPPVPGKNGEPKIVTGTDYLFTDPDNGMENIVEVTTGNGHSPSKLAQRRVVDQAGIENYHLLGISERTTLQRVLSPRDLLLLFREILK